MRSKRFKNVAVHSHFTASHFANLSYIIALPDWKEPLDRQANINTQIGDSSV